MAFNPKRKDGSYVDDETAPTTRMDARVVNVVRCLVEMEKAEIHRKREYSDTYASMEETGTSQLIGNDRELVKRWS